MLAMPHSGSALVPGDPPVQFLQKPGTVPRGLPWPAVLPSAEDPQRSLPKPWAPAARSPAALRSAVELRRSLPRP